jgi:hypothetical protein
VVGFLAVARTTGETYPYLFNWLRPLGMFVWLSSGWAIYRALPDSLGARVRNVGGPVLVGVTALVTASTLVTAVTFDPPSDEFSDSIAEVADDSIAAAGEGPVLIRPAGRCWFEALAGLALRLERAGVPVRVDDELGFVFGEHRTADDAVVELTIGCRDLGGGNAEAQFGELVAQHSRLTPDEDDEYDELVASVTERLQASGRDDLVPSVPTIWFPLLPDTGIDPATTDRLAELTPRATDRVAVYRRIPTE